MKKKTQMRNQSLFLMVACFIATNLPVYAAEPVQYVSSSEIRTEVNVDSLKHSVEEQPSDVIESSTEDLKHPSGRILSEEAVIIGENVKYKVTFATENGGDTVVLPRSIYGYAADYTDHSSGSFTVNAPGTATGTGHATIKTSDFGSSTQIIGVSIYRPDGTVAKANVRVTGNQEVVVSFSNAQPGNYTVAYSVAGSYKGWVHCWIY